MRYHSILALAMLGRKSRSWVVILFIFFVHAPGSSRFVHAAPDQERKEIRDAQVLETPDAVFVFVQVNHLVEHTGLISSLASRHPTKRVLSQSLITIDGQGNKSETPIVFSEDEKSPDIECNLSHIFVFKGTIFLMKFEARPIFFKWQKDRFVRVPHEEEGDLAKIMSSIEKRKLLADGISILDELTKESGWRYVDTTDLLNYHCKKHDMVIKLKYDDRRFTLPFVKSIVAESLSTTKPWTKTLIEIDPRKTKVVRKEVEEKEEK